jgi:hypothetical protein
MILRHSISKRNNVFYFLGTKELPEHSSQLKEFGLYFSSILVAICIFLVRADPFSGVCPFCFFMDFTIYVIGVDQPWVAVLARHM